MNVSARQAAFIYLKQLLRDMSCSKRQTFTSFHFNLSKTATLRFCKVVQRRYLCVSYFVANLSKTLHIHYYRNRSRIVEAMTEKYWCAFMPHSAVLEVQVPLYMTGIVPSRQSISLLVPSLNTTTHTSAAAACNAQC